MQPEEIIDFHIRHSWHKISRMYNQIAGKYDLTMSMGFILLIIDKDGTPSTQLGPRMGMEPTSLSRTLKTMEEKNLIFRQTDEIDKRKVLIFLTDEGLTKRTIARDVILNFNNKLKVKIPNGKLNAYFDVMMRIDKVVSDELIKLDLLDEIEKEKKKK